jgi:monoamine oxidase
MEDPHRQLQEVSSPNLQFDLFILCCLLAPRRTFPSANSLSQEKKCCVLHHKEKTRWKQKKSSAKAKDSAATANQKSDKLMPARQWPSSAREGTMEHAKNGVLGLKFCPGKKTLIL